VNVSLPRTAALVSMLVFAGAGIAGASGTARIEQSDGIIRQYRVSLVVVDHRGVRITSADRRGTLTVGKAACSYLGELERCLPYSIVLDQDGRKHSIAVQRGTEYLNRTATLQPLPYSSRHMPPHGLLLLLLTARGTYITVSGTVDGFGG
jgi:hypothetical protein